jgi:hypothetical protein
MTCRDASQLVVAPTERSDASQPVRVWRAHHSLGCVLHCDLVLAVATPMTNKNERGMLICGVGSIAIAVGLVIFVAVWVH